MPLFYIEPQVVFGIASEYGSDTQNVPGIDCFKKSLVWSLGSNKEHYRYSGATPTLFSVFGVSVFQ
jgi:hypothetical protein